MKERRFQQKFCLFIGVVEKKILIKSKEIRCSFPFVFFFSFLKIKNNFKKLKINDLKLKQSLE